MSSQADEVARLKAELAALQQETASLEKKPKKDKRKKKKRKTTEDDEAAKLRAELAAVDAETDAFIQRVVRAEFRDATVITIAHRLNTILDADKVLVLHEGRPVEFGPPKALMAKREGAFRQMVSAASDP